MSLPRQVLPGRTYLITRAIRSRRFYLAPDSGVNIIIWFCIAAAAAISGVQVHAVCAMSTHIHLVVTDVRGELPRFMHWLFRHTAVCLKALRGIEENVWAVGKPNVVELVTNEAILEAMAYTLANPSTAGLVERSKTWPGAISTPEDLHGRETVVSAPLQFFRKRPDEVLRFTVPEALLEDGTVADVVEALKRRIGDLEQEASEKLRSRGRNFLGLESIRRTKFWSRPKTPRKDVENGYRNPRIKAVVREALIEAKERLREFWHAYFEALELFQSGERPLFPAGTWWMVRHAGCEAVPSG